MTTQNQALSDELEALNSIYSADTLELTQTDWRTTLTSTVLTLPDLPFSFTISFAADYPDTPPTIVGIKSTGSSTKKGEGEAAVDVLRNVLANIFIPGQVCLFDLIEEVVPLLQPSKPRHQEIDNQQNSQLGDGGTKIQPQSITQGSTTVESHEGPLITQLQTIAIQDLTHSSDIAAEETSSILEPKWCLSDPLLFSKSTFIGRALGVRSLKEATDSIGHLLSTNKRVASATHNITAWRIKSKQQSSNAADDHEIIIQDCDDDGETAAGGRLLHLMQLMDVWNVVVVVTRWYGGVKLGPDRFRCINSVGREALVNGGFAKENELKSSGKTKHKKK